MHSPRRDTLPIVDPTRPPAVRPAAPAPEAAASLSAPTPGAETVREDAAPSVQLERTEQLAILGALAAGVAHEVNNLNNSIYFNVPILREYLGALRPLVERELAREPDRGLLGLTGDDFLKDLFGLVDHLQQASTRIADIVGELRDCTRPASGRERVPERPETMLDSVVTLAGRQVRKQVSDLEVDVEGPLPRVAVVPGKIEQVLLNLLLNAAQAADKAHAWVRISARQVRRDGDAVVRLRIEDNGAGIEPEALPRIFEPFFTTRGRAGGTGLGLYISRRIVEEHGGRILVSSVAGEGTTFVLELPVAT